MFDFLEQYTIRFWKWRLTVKATVTIALVVDPAPITADPTDTLGPVGKELPAGTALPIKGGTPPYTLTNVQGTVPPGVTVNSDGTLTGTPTQAGSFPLTIDVQDANG